MDEIEVMDVDEMDESPDSDQASGVIKEIHVINFMCYDNFSIKLEPKINFICGRNGSGKSAVQVAIVVVLGGRTISTGRGTSLKDLIKNGKNSCTIKVTLSNNGYFKYKPKQYGTEIIVERVISLSGNSGYKIKSEKGEVIATRKEELDKILNYFNIQISNPIAILHQDIARNFLNTDDPKKKFTFFNQATLHESIEEHHELTGCNIKEGLKAVENKEEVLEYFFKDIKVLENNLKTLQEAEEKVKKREEVRNELSWAKVHEEELSLKKFYKQKEKLEHAIQNINANVEHINMEDNDIMLRKRNLEQERNEIEKESENRTNILKVEREEHKQKNGQYQSLKEEVKELEARLERLRKREEAIRMMIYQSTHPDPEIEERKRSNELNLNEYKKQLLDINCVLETFEVEQNHLLENQDISHSNVSKFVNELRLINAEQGKRHMNIRTLKQESNNLSMYSNYMPKLVAAINAEKRFKEKPRGPLGAYIKVKNPNWAAAVEYIIGKNILSGFCVSSQRDYELLQRIIHRVCSKDAKPTIFNSKFFYQVHNVQEATLPGYSNLLRGLEISDPVVTNCLIDNVEIETLLMIPTNEEAINIMGRVENVPRHCKRSFTLTGDTFYPAPNYKSYGGRMKTNKAMLLQVDNNDTIKVLEEEVRHLYARTKEIEKLKNDAEISDRQLIDHINRITKDLKAYRKQKQEYLTKIRQIEEAIENENDQPMMSEQLEAELNELKNAVGKEEDKIKNLREKLHGLKTEAKEYKNQVTSSEEILAQFNTRKAGIACDICKIDSEIRNKNTQRAQFQDNLKYYEGLLITRNRDIYNSNKEIDKLREDAYLLSPTPINTKRSIEEVTEELRALDIYINSLETVSGGNLAEVTHEYMERKKLYKELKGHIEKFRGSLNHTDEIIKDRMKIHEKKRKRLGLIVSQTFDTHMADFNFMGELKFDYKGKELHINVRPKNEDAKETRSTASLSGGEKSYSTAAYLMSLWTHLNFPFHFLDEFDVFMDPVNRNKIMNILITQAKEQKKQFVFLTPLDMSNVKPSSDVQVFCLNAPRDSN